MLLLFKGYAAGPRHDQCGSGSNYLCLPEDPQWKNYLAEIQGHDAAGYIAGVEYELHNSGIYRNNVFSQRNNGGNQLIDNPAPCAVCYVGGRSTVFMVPARTQCPDGWTTEYAGYLVSERRTHCRTSYVCWDEAPEVGLGPTNQQNALIYPIEVLCGTLPCSVYFTGRELTCIVCSKWSISRWATMRSWYRFHVGAQTTNVLRHIYSHVNFNKDQRISFNCFCDNVRCPRSVTHTASPKSPAFLHYVTVGLHYKLIWH